MKGVEDFGITGKSKLVRKPERSTPHKTTSSWEGGKKDVLEGGEKYIRQGESRGKVPYREPGKGGLGEVVGRLALQLYKRKPKGG